MQSLNISSSNQVILTYLIRLRYSDKRKDLLKAIHKLSILNKNKIQDLLYISYISILCFLSVSTEVIQELYEYIFF